MPRDPQQPVAILEDYIAAAEPLLTLTIRTGADLREFRRQAFALGLSADAVGLAKGVVQAVDSGLVLNGLRLARHLFEVSVSLRYALHFGEPAWRQLLADDAKRRLSIFRTQWEGHREALALAIGRTGSLEAAAREDYLDSQLADWIQIQHQRYQEGRHEPKAVESLSALPGWAWPTDADAAAVAWHQGLRDAWAHLLAFGSLPSSPRDSEHGRTAAWLREAYAAAERRRLAPTQMAQLLSLLDSAGIERAPVGETPDLNDWAILEPELRARLADASRRDAEAKAKRSKGEATPLEERGVPGGLPDLCRMIGRPDEHAILYGPASWLSHPRLTAADANLCEREGRLGVGAQPAGLGVSAAALAIASLDPLLEEGATYLGVGDAVRPTLATLRARSIAL